MLWFIPKCIILYIYIYIYNTFYIYNTKYIYIENSVKSLKSTKKQLNNEYFRKKNVDLMSSYFCNKHTVTQDSCIDANIDISFDFLTILRAV